MTSISSISKKKLRKNIASPHNNTINEGTTGSCLKCFFKKYTCRSCQVNYLKRNFTNWTSGNENIDNFIQKIQLERINSRSKYSGFRVFEVFEWIPYNQFSVIKIISQDSYLAVWKDGPLYRKFDK
jgi:hypothetical protein